MQRYELGVLGVEMPEANGHVAMTVKEMLAAHSRTLEDHSTALISIERTVDSIEAKVDNVPDTIHMLDQRVDHLESRWDRTFGALMAIGALITIVNIGLIIFNVVIGAFHV